MKHLMVVILLFLVGCTANEKAKKYGGTAEMELEKGQKLITVTWKDDNLWYLTRPMIMSDTATTYFFKEKSSYGNWEGTYIIQEVK